MVHVQPSEYILLYRIQ